MATEPWFDDVVSTKTFRGHNDEDGCHYLSQSALTSFLIIPALLKSFRGILFSLRARAIFRGNAAL